VSAAAPVKVPLTPPPCPPEVLGAGDPPCPPEVLGGLEVLGAEDPEELLELVPDPLDGGGANGMEPAAEATLWLVLVW
jgi:hypothetical protein